MGYTQGTDTAPTYEGVCSGRTGHTEAVQVSSVAHIMIAVPTPTTVMHHQFWVLPQAGGRASTASSCSPHACLLSCSWRPQVYYKPGECSYEDLLNCFFNNVDPTTKNRQGMDMGTQYRSGIYYHNDAQKQAAEKVGPSGPLFSWFFSSFVPCKHVPCA